MHTLQSKTHVEGVTGKQITDFLQGCDDAAYQRWWPGTHLHYRMQGNTVFMDEYVGKRRLKFTGVVSEVVPGRKLVWTWRGLVRLVLEFEDDPKGVRVTHTICAGFQGLGSVLDPLFRLYLSKRFERSMDVHVKTEFPRLAHVLH